jgi:hypothetical protein
MAREEYQTADFDTLATPIGELAVTTSPDRISSTLTLDGKVIQKLDGSSSLSPVITGDSRQYVLIFNSTGGTACYGDFVVLELKRPLRFSESFGNCNDAFDVSVRNGDLVVEMPRVLPDPDNVSAAERRRVDHTMDVYTLHNGKVTDAVRRTKGSADTLKPSAAVPTRPEPAGAVLAVSSRVPAIKIVASNELPSVRTKEKLGAFCQNYVITPVTVAGRAAASRGWYLTTEVSFGPYFAVGIFSKAEDGTSSSCLIKDGNIVVYQAGNLVAIAYAKPANNDGDSGDIGSVLATSMPGTVRIWPGTVGSPTADLAVTTEGLVVNNVAAQDSGCNGRVQVPNIFDMTIENARVRLAKFGWKPALPTKEESQADPAWDRAAAMRKTGLTEVHECAGTGFGFCGLDYRHSGGENLSVTTADDPPQVISYDIRCPK